MTTNNAQPGRANGLEHKPLSLEPSFSIQVPLSTSSLGKVRPRPLPPPSSSPPVQCAYAVRVHLVCAEARVKRGVGGHASLSPPHKTYRELAHWLYHASNDNITGARLSL